jgi:hypothetical protein
LLNCAPLTTADRPFDAEAERALRYFSIPSNADGREAHWVLVQRAMTAAASRELPGTGLCPVPDGSPEFAERYAWVDAQFQHQLASDPRNLILVRNYCRFLSERELPRAMRMAEDAVAAAPTDVRTLQVLNHLRQRVIIDTEDLDQARILKRTLLGSLRTEVDLGGDDPGILNYRLIALAQLAYAVGEQTEARASALRCLAAYQRSVGRPPPERVRAGVHQNAHSLLGLLALDGGDAAGAATHLLASVDLPAVDAFGVDYPDLRLARRLFAAGAQAGVLQFAEKLLTCCSPCDRPAVQSFREWVIANLRAAATG